MSPCDLPENRKPKGLMRPDLINSAARVPFQCFPSFHSDQLFPMFTFDFFEKNVFLMFSGGIKREHLEECVNHRNIPP